MLIPVESVGIVGNMGKEPVEEKDSQSRRNVWIKIAVEWIGVVGKIGRNGEGSLDGL